MSPSLPVLSAGAYFIWVQLLCLAGVDKYGSLRQLLKERCSGSNFRDDDLKKLVDAGYETAATLAAATTESLTSILHGRYGVVDVLLKPFGATTESVDEVMKEWKLKYSKFLEKSKEKRCELSIENGVPLHHRGRPSILLDRLTTGWTKDVPSLWKQANDALGEVVPVIGVSGSGKTRFLYELLVEKWGFFWTAKTKENGGSKDVRLMTEYKKVHYKAANHSNVMKITRCAILARLLILEIFLDEIPDLKPLQWLMLQGRLEYKFIVVLDETQILGSIGVDCYESPESRVGRSIFSPLVKALQKPSMYLPVGPVIVASTSVSFLKLEVDIRSVIGKESVEGQLRFASAPFFSWEDVDEVLEFCKPYLKLENGKERDNACYLLRKFRGRRRCLVSCVERLLQLTKGVWSEKVVDDYFKEITNSSNSNDVTSIYYDVEALYESKGHFYVNKKKYDADALVRRLGLFVPFGAEG